ncbi:MAG: NAD(P)-dependent glycerol-3-phosphate dehydrogenase [Planctomycetota bacterium]|nr:MAG: NAD(P)-dependent glycerol-3-phosphate dehydrogenase [Planctomycetota bacterium]
MKKKTIAIIGDGAWGTALGLVAAENGHGVRIWGAFPDYVAEVARSHENTKFLPGIKLPDVLEHTADFAEAVDGADLVLNATPTQFVRGVFEKHARFVPDVPILSVSKGIEIGTFKRATEILEEFLPERAVAVLMGPSHAEEVAGRMPTAVTIGATDERLAVSVQQLFNTGRFRVYRTIDRVGVEVGGALKNIIAVCAGILDGLGLGDNTKAALLTRGLVEMAKLGVVLGGSRETFYGLSGMGDLVTTCYSPHGRNRAVGERLGRGETLQQILDSMEKVAEGVWTTKAVVPLAKEQNIEMPIAEELHRVLFEDRKVMEAIDALMSRDWKAE